MRNVLLSIVLATVVAGCGLTGQGVLLNSTTVYEARQAFNAVEQTATNYLTTCHANPANVLCKNKSAVEAALVPAVRAGRQARNGLTACLKSQQTGGCQTALDQLAASTGVVRNVLLQFGVGG